MALLAAALLGTALAAYHGGQAYTAYKKSQDYRQMDRDFRKNTGRRVKYGWAEGYRSKANDQMLNSWNSAARAASGAYGAGTTYRDIFNDD